MKLRRISCNTLFRFKHVFGEIAHFIFNKINITLNEPEITFYESLEKYYEEYKPKENTKYAKI